MPTHRAILLPVLTLLMIHSAPAQDRLKWNLQSGEKLNYTIVQKMTSSTTIGDESVKSKYDQTIDMSWNVLSNAANGDIVLAQVFDRVRLQMEGQPAGKVQFDTSSPTPSDNPIAKALSDVFGNIVRQPFQVRMRSTGDIADVQIPEKLLAAIEKSGAVERNMISDMMKQSAVMLPPQAVQPGSKWNSVQEIQMPFGTMKISSTMTYHKKDEEGNAVLGVIPVVEIQPREGVAARMALTGSSGRGVVIFDVARGRVKQTQLEVTLNLTLDVNGQKLPQTVSSVTSMTLTQ